MPLQKRTLNLPFSQGVDTKTDPWQVQPGKLLELENAVFEKQGLLKKRNGFPKLKSLPDNDCDTVTTFKNNLICFGEKFYSLDTVSNEWIDYGSLKSVKFNAFPIVRRATSQITQNTVVANGIACTIWSDSSGSSYYQLSNAENGQIIVSQKSIDSGAKNPNIIVTSHSFIIFYTKNTGTNDLLAIRVPFNYPYSSSSPVTIANTLSSLISPYAVISSSTFPQNCYVAHINGSNINLVQFDALLNQVSISVYTTGITINYISLYSYTPTNGSSTGAHLALVYFLNNGTTDTINFRLYDANLNFIAANTPYTSIAGAFTYNNLSFSLLGNSAKIIYTTQSPLYGGIGSILSNLTQIPVINKISLNWDNSFTFSSTTQILKQSVGLASNLFVYNDKTYFIASYDMYNPSASLSVSQQPTLFLMDEDGNAVGKFCALNSAWNISTKTLPNVSKINDQFYCGYLIKTVISGFRTQPDSSITSSNVGGFYSETGINLAIFDFAPKSLDTSEIGNNLNLSGGIVKCFDGANITEQNFNLFPEQCAVITNSFDVSISNASPAVVTLGLGIPKFISENDPIRFEVTGSLPSPLVVGTTYYVKTILTTSPTITFTISSSPGGSAINTTTMGSGVSTIIGVGNVTTANAPYFYQAIYSYTDAQGNEIKSGTSPSFPIGGFTPTKNNCTVSIFVPKIWITDKTQNNLPKIVPYRWSTNEQIFHDVIADTSYDPLINDLTVSTSYVFSVDKASNTSILGNPTIYTTGGVLDNCSPPAASAIALYKNRLWLVDAEDKNLLWFSKPVLEGVPVEFSQTQTIYVSPSLVVNDSGATITALAAMDDKLVIFKKESIYYLTGIGPDITGANNDFNDPTFITSTIGCINTKSIVLMPNGLMFESDKGRWLLARDLSTTYIGAPVEAFNSFKTLSALTIPGTNQVRFTLDNGITLMYDYYFGQWGTFTGINNIGATIYNGKHTIINKNGDVYQESSSSYQDGNKPVNMKIKTSWINLAGLQGLERAYYAYLISNYASPHKLLIDIAFDYNNGSQQSVTITPTNYTNPYGNDALYGSTNPYGGPGTLEQFRIFLSKQKCQSFQMIIQEQFDGSLNTIPGAGFTLSGLNLTVGVKLGHPKLPASQSVS
jgi:hypothetical protein